MPFTHIFLRFIVTLCLSSCFSFSTIYASENDDSVDISFSYVESLRYLSAKSLIKELLESEQTIENLQKLQQEGVREYIPSVSLPDELAELIDDLANHCKIDNGKIFFPNETNYYLFSERGKIENSAQSSEDKITNLNVLHQKMLQSTGLMNGLYPAKQSPFQKLANIYIELVIWAQVRAQVWDEVGAQVGAQVDEVRAVLPKLLLEELASSYGTENFKENLKFAIHYTFLLYQLSSTVMRYSPEIIKIQKEFAEFLEDKITDEQANAILKGINIPKSDDLLIDTQLEFIRKNQLAELIEQ